MIFYFIWIFIFIFIPKQKILQYWSWRKNNWIFSGILSKFVHILAAFSKKRQSYLKKFQKKANELTIIKKKRWVFSELL